MSDKELAGLVDSLSGLTAALGELAEHVSVLVERAAGRDDWQAFMDEHPELRP